MLVKLVPGAKTGGGGDGGGGSGEGDGGAGPSPPPPPQEPMPITAITVMKIALWGAFPRSFILPNCIAATQNSMRTDRGQAGGSSWPIVRHRFRRDPGSWRSQMRIQSLPGLNLGCRYPVLSYFGDSRESAKKRPAESGSLFRLTDLVVRASRDR